MMLHVVVIRSLLPEPIIKRSRVLKLLNFCHWIANFICELESQVAYKNVCLVVQ